MVKVPLMGLGLAVVCALGVTARAESGSQQFAAVRSVPFSLAAPAGPQFTDAQKQRQREAGRNVLPLVFAAFSNGADSVRIPSGDYRFGMEHWGRDGVVSALQFTDLQRDAQHPFTIDASNATFWFDLGNDERPTHHFCAGFRRCRNLIFKGATIDRDPRGNIEGSITRFDAANNRIEVQLSPGVTLPTTFNNNGDQHCCHSKRMAPFVLRSMHCNGVVFT